VSAPDQQPPARDPDDDSRSDIHEDLSSIRTGEPPGATRKAARSPLVLHAALFLATFLTTTCAGALYVHGMERIAPINDGLSYSIPLMLILVCHELGHYFVARLHGVDASLPYFIPFFPWFGLGTLGAVISMRRVTSDRKKLIDIGAAGPLAGLAVAIPVLLYGLAQSKVVPLAAFGRQEGNSILYALLKLQVTGLWLPDGRQDVLLHPTAWAGWAGLLVTMINLLPVGQLDGGHVATAYFGNRYNIFARRLHRLMPFVAAGVFIWVYYLVRVEMGARWKTEVGLNVAAYATVPWLVWYGLVGALRRAGGGANHPPVDPKPLPRSRKVLFWVMVVVFIGIFMPVPARETFGRPDPSEPDRPPVSASLP
jgi:membrane-associated protease RseP (regulator of RpoE activity)